VGKSSSTGYWIIKLPGSSTICWLFPQHATVSGNTANLPEYPVPPTPTPSAPATPKNFKANVSCVLQNNPIFINLVEVKLTWEDVATNESGYRIYEDGTEIVALAADSTSYKYDTTLAAIWLINTPKPSHTYTIEAYNSAGNSDQKNVKVECP
jgi:hypothetical protein